MTEDSEAPGVLEKLSNARAALTNLRKEWYEDCIKSLCDAELAARNTPKEALVSAINANTFALLLQIKRDSLISVVEELW